jgi:phage terminase Nu1 subunit (DNA packaging protein)
MGKQGMIYTRKIIAQVLGISEKRVRQLTEEGVLEEFSNGHYKLLPAVQGYVRYLQSLVADDDQSTDYNQEKARLTKIKREDAELDLKHKRNELHHSTDVKFVMSNSLVSFKARLETLPHKVLPLLMNIPEKAGKSERILEILKESVAETLKALSKYNPNDFTSESEVK